MPHKCGHCVKTLSTVIVNMGELLISFCGTYKALVFKCLCSNTASSFTWRQILPFVINTASVATTNILYITLPDEV